MLISVFQRKRLSRNEKILRAYHRLIDQGAMVTAAKEAVAKKFKVSTSLVFKLKQRYRNA